MGENGSFVSVPFFPPVKDVGKEHMGKIVKNPFHSFSSFGFPLTLSLQFLIPFQSTFAVYEEDLVNKNQNKKKIPPKRKWALLPVMEGNVPSSFPGVPTFFLTLPDQRKFRTGGGRGPASQITHPYLRCKIHPCR